jgi:hypothetical protein
VVFSLSVARSQAFFDKKMTVMKAYRHQAQITQKVNVLERRVNRSCGGRGVKEITVALPHFRSPYR